MKIEKLKLSEITPYINNAKEHPQEQIDQIKGSIKEFGFNNPIAVDENNAMPGIFQDLRNQSFILQLNQ